MSLQVLGVHTTLTSVTFEDEPLNGYCGDDLGTARALGSLVVEFPLGGAPESVYLELTDRRAGRIHRSNLLDLADAGPQFMELPAPALTGPPDQSSFSRLPRITTLRWERVAGGPRYFLEVQRWTGESWSWETLTPTTNNSATLDFESAGVRRWRVRAINQFGSVGHPSEWWEFTHTK